MKLVDTIYQELIKDEDFRLMGMDQQGEMVVEMASRTELAEAVAENTNDLDGVIQDA